MSYCSYTNVSSNIDMNENGNDGFQYFIVDCSSGNINITLSSNPYDSQYYCIIRIDNNTSNTLTLTASNSLLINGSSSITLSVNNSCELIFINNVWLCPKYSFTL